MIKDLTFTVAVSTFNRNEDLFRCLQSLRKQDYNDFDIVVSNGGEYAGVKDVVGEFKDLKIMLVNQQRKGLVEGRNLGWRNARSDIVCFIDDDLIVSPEWLGNIKGTFLSDEAVGGVSGPTIIPEDRKGNRDFVSLLDRSKTSRNIFVRLAGKVYMSLVLENKINVVGTILKSGVFTPGSNYKDCLSLPGNIEVDYLEACHMCFRRKLLEELNGFDYIYKGTGEWQEPDFSFRVKSRGYKLIFNPKAVTYHCISKGGVFKARTNSYERSQNFIIFYMRWVKPDTLEKALRFCANIIFMNLYWCYKFFQSRNPDWLKGIAGTFAGLVNARRLCA